MKLDIKLWIKQKKGRSEVFTLENCYFGRTKISDKKGFIKLYGTKDKIRHTVFESDLISNGDVFGEVYFDADIDYLCVKSPKIKSKKKIIIHQFLYRYKGCKIIGKIYRDEDWKN